jgi:glycosyltransferase involved in cell wall biosynthesis
VNPTPYPAVDLSVVMPCLNEARTVGTCVRKARLCIARLGITAEVIVADNGSTDGSQEIAEREGARIVNVSERGYGAALYDGIRSARGQVIVMADSDDSYDFDGLAPFVSAVRDGADLAMGNRFRGGIEPGAMPWKNRYLGTPVLSRLGQVFFGCPVSDFNCGIRGISRRAFDRLDLQTTGMEFASEMVIKATLLGMTIVEVPTTLKKDGRDGKPHLRPWRDGWRHLRFMLLYSPTWLFLYPGMALMAAGAILGVALLPGPVMLRSDVGLDVHTLLFCMAAVLIGFQGVAFGFCARVYALTTGLLSRDVLLERLFKRFTLESGLLIGAALVMLGLAGAVYALAGWSAVDFGRLDARHVLRTAIPSVLAICLGGQIVLTSFLLSFFGLRRR